jgi:polar amino acid transport system permease protein
MLGGFTLIHLLYLIAGLCWTVVLSLIAFALGGVAGLAVTLARISRLAPIRWLSLGYVQIIQGTPLLIILFAIYFGLGIIGWELPPIVAAGVALMVYASAFLGEIWKGCVEAVARTQWEAAECLALTRGQALRMVILPQAMRIAIPPTVGFLVQVIKSTSLASVVGFVELTRAGQVINNSIFQPFLVFILVGAMYFALCYPLSKWSQSLERRLNVGRRQIA